MLFCGCVPCFQVAWNDESNPALGFKYLYLTSEDYEVLAPGTVNAKEVTEGGEKRYALSDIIGQVTVGQDSCGLLTVMGITVYPFIAIASLASSSKLLGLTVEQK